MGSGCVLFKQKTAYGISACLVGSEVCIRDRLHREAGFTANGMIVWKVPEQRITEVGNKLGAFPQVSHCYERPVYPDWPYNVFSMIHCKSFDEAGEVAGQIQKQIDVDEYKILFSAKEFKKTRVEYFVENEFSLEEKIPA